MSELRRFLKAVVRGRLPLTRRNLRVCRKRSKQAHADPISRAPHDIAIYEALLEQLRAESSAFVSAGAYLEGGAPGTHILRHDLDTEECQSGLPGLVAVERRLGLRSTIYVIVDGSAYDPSAHAASLNALQQDGFELGLHTRAHFQDDPIRYLTTEVERFRELFGGDPPTATLHGELPRSEDYPARRAAFKRRFDEVEEAFGVRFLNNVRYQILSDAVFVPSGDDGRTPILKEGFADPSSHLYEGQVVVINTHPLYWGAR